ncbi:MAG: hypothetical protein CM1200mP18_20020 [Gammaproteobacteria bacterium]|nr:MAG: hypothetical protein CM1200mP18_20020 [Gammaproteobacteria bacterium]
MQEQPSALTNDPIGARTETRPARAAGGEDLAAGEIALVLGAICCPRTWEWSHRWGWGKFGGIAKPRIAFFSNGDELRSIGETLALGDFMIQTVTPCMGCSRAWASNL